jgi:hypothetical protein
MPFPIHPASERADLSFTDAIELSKSPIAPEGSIYVGIEVELFGHVVYQLAPRRKAKPHGNTGANEEN